MKNGITVEICAGSLNDGITASSFEEVDRIELNCALELGGLTPSVSTLNKALAVSEKQIIAMVRPRPAGFIYTQSEKALMYEDACVFLKAGAHGIVFGSLNPDHTVDEPFTIRMVQLIHSYNAQAVFHKAFDDTADPFLAAETLANAGIDRILTSGKQSDALKGAPLIKALNERYANRITFLPGGGVNEQNAKEILRVSGSREIHMSAKETIVQDGGYFAVSKERIENILVNL